MTLNRLRRKAWALPVVLTVAVAPTARGGSIFDDDYKPSERPAPSPSAPPPSPERPSAAPRPEAPAPPPAPRIRPTAVGPAKLVKYPVAAPSESACASVEKLVHEVYKEEFARKTPAEKAALGLRLLTEARQEGNDLVTRFVLYRDAVEACAAGKELGRGLEAIDEMSWIFAVDRLTMALNQLIAVNADPATLPSVAQSGANAGLCLTAEALAAGRYAEAVKLAQVAQSLSRKSRDPALGAWTGAWAQQTREIEDKARQLATALAKLKASPGDPAASAEVGAFYCFWCGFWDRGLPLLAKGDDPALKSLAEKELAATGADPVEPAKLADEWLTESEKQSGSAKEAIQRRACKWYRVAIPQLSGLPKLSAQKHVEQLLAPQLQHGLMSDIYRGEKLVGHVRRRVDPVVDFNWDSVLADPLVQHDHFSICWTGWLKAPSPGVYKILTRVDDGVRVWLNGEPIMDHWQWGDSSLSATVTLGAEPVELRMEYFQYTGGAHLGLGWIMPGSPRPKAIPVTALYHEPIEFGQMLKPLSKSDADGCIRLSAEVVRLHGAKIKQNPTQNQDAPYLGEWDLPNDWVSWDFTAPTGSYDVSFSYGATDECNGATYTLGVNGACLTGTVNDSGGWFNWANQDAGRIELAGGNETLWIRPASLPRGRFMQLQSVTLTPVKQE